MRLNRKSAIVTGGASGFGAGIVRRFILEGARVVIADINGDAATELADELGEAALGLKVDVADRDDVARLVTTAIDFAGGIDILVNNAGVGHTPEPMESLSEENFDRIFEVNIKSIYRTAQAIVPLMKEKAPASF